MTLREYYKSYLGLLGALAAVVAAAPIVSLIPTTPSLYVFPPLGDVGGAARGASLFATVAATFLVYFIKPKYPVRSVILCLIASVMFAFAYAGAYLAFVRVVNIPAKAEAVTVTVGYHRSDFAVQNFLGYTDEEILRNRGFTDEEIRRCWTPASLWTARIVLWLPCTLALFFLVSALGLGIVATDAKDLSTAESH